MKSPIEMNEAEMRSRFDFSKATRGRFHERYKNGHAVVLLDRDPDEGHTSELACASETTRQSGKRIFEANVRAAGLIFDEPANKDGIDYLIYQAGLNGAKRSAYSVKVRTSIHEVFSLYKKDSRIPHLLVAYVWHARNPEESSVYALTYEEALRIVQRKPYLTSKSWQEEGGYSVTHAGTELKEMMRDYRMTPERWHQRLNIL